MVVVHVAAGALGMLVGLFLFRGYGLLWMLVLSVLAGNVAILMSGVVVAVKSYRNVRDGASAERWKSASNVD
ncbi:MAG: hypothetical protein ABWZ27_08955 [Aestuariivirgaceae bacterium]